MKNVWLQRNENKDLIRELYFLQYHMQMSKQDCLTLTELERKHLIKCCVDQMKRNIKANLTYRSKKV